jgi:hypothetical protein
LKFLSETIQEAACDSVNCLFRKPETIMENSKNFEAFRYYFSKSQADDWLSAFSKAELRFPILFEELPVLEILMRLPVKSPELVSVFTEASKNFKSNSLNN